MRTRLSFRPSPSFRVVRLGLVAALSLSLGVAAQTGPDQTGFTSDFEDGTLKGYVLPDGTTVRNWGPRGGDAAVANSTEQAHGGTHALKTTGRRRPYQGPSLNVLGKMTKGFRYRVTVWARLVADPAFSSVPMSVTLQRTYQGTTTYVNVVPQATVTAAEWSKLSALYTPADDADALALYVETSEADPAPPSGSTTYPLKASFYVDDVSLAYSPALPIQTAIPSLKDVLAGEFRFGGAVSPAEIADPIHAALIRKHLGSLTAGNAMKTGPIHPTLGEADGNYAFADADAIANFARSNGLTLRGHTLLWHDQNPSWLFKDASGADLAATPASRALMLQRLGDHIRKVVRRYRDVVSTWDVVNEVTDPDQSDGLRRSDWYRLAGPTDFIDKAFQVASEEAPGAKLCINEYSTTDARRRQALVAVVQGMKSRGVPVSCVGHQMHVNLAGPPASDASAAIQAFAALGLDNQITEMDVSVYTDSTSRYPEIPAELLYQQATRYRDFFREYRRLKASISSVTLWGVADDNTWLTTFPIARLDLPLLFDADLQAKPAYWAVVDSAPAGMSAIFPSSARAAGAGGAFYTTDVTVANTGPSDATVQLKFLGHDADGRGGPELSFPLSAGRSTTFSDVLGSVFGKTADFGAIRVTSSSAAVRALAQTSTPGFGGTFGQSVPAAMAEDLVVGGVPRSVLGVREDAAFRTNLILANAGEDALDVDVMLVAANGTSLVFQRAPAAQSTALASGRYTLPPLGMTQVSRVVRALGVSGDVSGARLVLSTPAAGKSFAAYASTIDNVTNDPRTLLPIGPIASARPGADFWILPSSARAAGAGGAFYTTDLAVAYTGDVSARYTVKFLGNNKDGRAGAEQTFDLAARRSVAYADILGSVFGLASDYGAIRVASQFPASDSALVAVLGQTSTPGFGGTFGQSVPAATAADLIRNGTERSILAVREDGAFRTNLILTNATEGALAVDVRLVGGDGATLGTKTYALQPLGMTQVSRVVRDVGVGTDVSGARVVLSTPTAGGSFAAYASVIDNVTNDPRTLLPK
ncbi:MAG: endo-1,4-beta-xylanase [Acidobacteriota bacterium]